MERLVNAVIQASKKIKNRYRNKLWSHFGLSFALFNIIKNVEDIGNKKYSIV
jgi:hypothetical protein